MSATAQRDSTIAHLPSRTLAWLREALTSNLVVCVDARYEVEGSLGLTFERHGARFDLRLVAGREVTGDAVPVPDGALVPAGAPDDAQWQGVAAWVARRLERLRERYRVPVLELFRDEQCHEPYTFDAGLFHARLGPLFVPGTTRYGAYVFVSERFHDDTLVYEFESASGVVVLHVRHDAHEPRACFRTRHFSATLARDDRTQVERGDPMAQVERYVGFLLARCDAPDATYRRREPSRRAFVDDRPLFGAKLDGQFFVREIGHDYLSIYDAFWGLELPADLLIHGDCECSGMGTNCPAPLRRLWTTPLDLRPDATKGGRVSFTGLDDVDLIRGGEERLRAALDSLGRAEPERLLVVLDTCVPQVIGDDIEQVVADYVAGGSRPVALLSCRMEEHSPHRGAGAFWLDVLKHLARDVASSSPPGVNLVGYGLAGSPEVVELSALLDRVGVATNAVLFPGLGGAHAARFRAATAAVVNPWRYVTSSYAPIAAWAGLPGLALPMPYGVAGTQRWLEAVALAVLGSRPPVVPGPDEALAAAWRSLTDQAGAHEVAFVTLSTQLDLPTDPTETRGIPLVATLLEMGFAVTLHVVDDAAWRAAAQRRAPGPFLAELVAGLGMPARLTTRVWSDVDAVLSHLEAGPAALVYSELLDDPRVRELGLAQLGPEDFRPGFCAAVDTVRELVRRARDPFRSTYRRYLAGRRPNP